MELPPPTKCGIGISLKVSVFLHHLIYTVVNTCKSLMNLVQQIQDDVLKQLYLLASTAW